MTNWVGKLRNRIETDNLALPLGFYITQNRIYRNIVYAIAKRKIAKVEKDKTYNIAIEVSSFCNAHCSFCPNSRMKRKKSTMTMEIFNKIVERIKKENIKPQSFNLTGTGEPLMDKNLIKKIIILKKIFPLSKVYFPTNLAMANETKIKEIINSGLDELGISLNASNKKDYEKIMNLDYENTLQNLEDLIRMKKELNSNMKISISLAANTVNKSNVEEFLKKWEKRVDRVVINWIHSWAGAVDNGVKTKMQIRYPCLPLFEQIIFHSNGNIPLCLVDYEGNYVGGNVMKDKILDSFNARKIKEIKQKHLAGNFEGLKMCSNCRFSERGLYWLV
jgi:wyosine [tRNA(Phe)-imidazoG37] synthetase (radical SAM superfamily)